MLLSVIRFLNKSRSKILINNYLEQQYLRSIAVRFKSQDTFDIDEEDKDTNRYLKQLLYSGILLNKYTFREYGELVSQFIQHGSDHSCFIIHPYVKWGPQKIKDTNPELQLEEAVSLIRTLESWKICGR